MSSYLTQHPQPNKNNKEQDKYLKINYNQIQPNDNSKSLPIVCNFPVNTPSISELEESNKISLYKRKNKQDYRVVGDMDNIEFEGKANVINQSSSKYLICCFNKRKREISISDSFICEMNQHSKSVKINEKPLIDNSQKTQETYMNNKSLLVQDFGTSKSKKVIESMKSNIVNEENISSIKPMHEIINKKSQIEEKLIQSNKINGVSFGEESMREIIPSYKLGVSDIREVFDLDSSKYKYKHMIILLLIYTQYFQKKYLNKQTI